MNPMEIDLFSLSQQPLFKSTNFGTVDILASTGVCGVSSLYAATHPSYRVSFNGNEDVGFAEDVRFVLGSTSLFYLMLVATQKLLRFGNLLKNLANIAPIVVWNLGENRLREFVS